MDQKTTAPSCLADEVLNLLDPGFFGSGDPYPIWKRMREESPVFLTKSHLKKPFWSVTSYEGAKYVLMHDNRIFNIQPNGPNIPMGPEFEDPEKSLWMKLLQTGQQLSVMDGTPHSLFRRYFVEKFSPAGVKILSDLIRDVTHDALDDLIERGEGDFTGDFAGRVPTAVIAAMMDIPKDRWDDLYLWNNMLAAPDDPEFSVGNALETSTQALNKIIDTCADMADSRRGKDGDDILTLLTRAEINGRPLTRTEIGFNGQMFFTAGHETTRSSISAGLIELIRQPSQWEYLKRNRHNPDVLRTAADEFVRFSSPLTHTLRTATEDTEIIGTPIKEGDLVVVWFHPANRDEAVFTNPDICDVTRTPNPHLGFAVGKHSCLGAHLARLDMQIMMEVMLERLDEIELAGPVEMASSNLFWGVKRLPVRVKGRMRSKNAEAA